MLVEKIYKKLFRAVTYETGYIPDGILLKTPFIFYQHLAPMVQC